MFKNPFSFDGRIRRMEYGLSMIIYVFVYITVLALTGFGAASGSGVALLPFLLMIPLVWFVWAQGAKRCHDINKSGWWQLIPFFFFVLLFQDGDMSKNEYGSNPKYPEQADVLETETLDGHMKNY